MRIGWDGLRVVIADAHPLYRDGLVQAIGSDEFDVAGICADGRAALDKISETQPDVALIGLDLCHLDGLAVARAVEERALATRVVLISADPDPATLYDALAAGAAGFLSKRSSADEIREAVRIAGRGGAFLGPDLHGRIAREIRNRRGAKPALSEREREILRLAARGNTARQIGEELFIGATTVRTHLQHAYEKLGVQDKSSAIAEAMRRGVLT